MAVNAAVGKKSVKMQASSCFQHMAAGVVQRNIIEKDAVFNGLCNLGQFLVNNTSGTDVQMADFGVAHLAFRKAHSKAAGIDSHRRVFSKNSVQFGRFRCGDGISVFGII